MPRGSSGLFSWFATCPMGVAVAAVLTTTSAGLAGPMQAALVENVTGRSAQVEVMDYLDAGQTIRLGPHDTIVLSYLHSCVRDDYRGNRDGRRRAERGASRENHTQQGRLR